MGGNTPSTRPAMVLTTQQVHLPIFMTSCSSSVEIPSGI